MFKVLNWNLHLFRLLEIIQVLDSISWVRCASGNILTSQRTKRISIFLPNLMVTELQNVTEGKIVKIKPPLVRFLITSVRSTDQTTKPDT